VLTQYHPQFDQIQVRETEIKELEAIMERIPCEVKVSIPELHHEFQI